MQRTLVGLDSIIVSRGPTAPHSLEVLWYPKQHPSFHEITDDMQDGRVIARPIQRDARCKISSAVCAFPLIAPERATTGPRARITQLPARHYFEYRTFEFL